MKLRNWLKTVVVLGVCVLAVSGCRKKTADLGGGSTVYGQELENPSPRAADDIGTRIPSTETGVETVLFSYDSFQVAETEMAKIQKAAEFIKATPGITCICEGNGDERGSNEYNMSLGQNRADAVRAALVGLGVDASKVQTKSFGEEQPVDMAHCEDAWSKNRRVEFGLYKQ